jgi:hypothetical protein
MPTGIVSKVDLLSRVLKLKDNIYHKRWYPHWNDQERKAADDAINNVLDILDEYRL